MEGEFSRQRLLREVVLTVVLGLVLDRREVAQAAVQPAGVEPADPAQSGEFEVVDTAPGPFTFGALGLVEPDQAFGLGVEAPMSSG